LKNIWSNAGLQKRRFKIKGEKSSLCGRNQNQSPEQKERESGHQMGGGGEGPYQGVPGPQRRSRK